MNALPRSVALLLAVALASACSSTSGRIGRMYAALQADVGRSGSDAMPAAKLSERNAARATDVREMVAKGEVKSARDRFESAVLLVETDDPENLALAERLALEAVASGEKLGSRVAAEAADKQLVKRHLPQRYGTQYEWVPVLQAWRLYSVDPTTTDAERRAMGVPPLAELVEGEKRLNAPKGRG
jgi:hypothetical protein